MNLREKGKSLFSILKKTYLEWISDDPFRQSAVIAYYSIFSLPALLIIIIKVVGRVFGEEDIRKEITAQISSTVSESAAQQVQTMIDNVSQQGDSTFAIAVGIGTLLFGATGVFVQLQLSLNKVWEVEAKPESGILKIALDRVLSLGFILGVGFLLIVSLALTAGLQALGNFIQQFLPDYLLYIFQIAEILLSLGVITTLFAMIYKFLPDVDVEWRSVWVGASVTALLFVLGKIGLGIYFGQTEPGSAFGAAGAVILILLWVNYSALIFLFGAEFTQVYARRKGHKFEPSDHARWSAERRLADYKEEHGIEKENA
ncbi:YihY/virulence factor BrkB family protein [Tunicatimonas pelagia]|uniref:YihY/virulence factor BrkB family protein n=1 Tax=Tunicatimonas pelagia TaxID=931531 RepID=UPI0026669CF1|nr:YihY/virulence factor BrkB family protein [Tunicatimonas pelagia]WKN43632.1 YihY/virulence factor BrkB family protein [Tunicatimonas pelagia]